MKTPQRILIVEDEKVLRTSMVRGLSRLPDVVVDGAGTVAEALQIVDRATVDFVISDIDLPDRLGIELIGELRARKCHAPIVFVSAYLKAYQSQIPPNAQVQVYEKPLSIEQLRKIVTDRVHANFSKEAAPFGLADYIQLASLGRHSVGIDVSGEEVSGRVIIVNGEGWSAVDAHGRGGAALQRLVMARRASVLCSSLRGDAGERNLEGSAEALLLEAARLSDEGLIAQQSGTPEAEAGNGVSLLGQSPLEDAESATDRASNIRDKGVEAMMRKDYAQALVLFQQAVSLGCADRTVTSNIERLKHILANR